MIVWTLEKVLTEYWTSPCSRLRGFKEEKITRVTSLQPGKTTDLRSWYNVSRTTLSLSLMRSRSFSITAYLCNFSSAGYLRNKSLIPINASSKGKHFVLVSLSLCIYMRYYKHTPKKECNKVHRKYTKITSIYIIWQQGHNIELLSSHSQMKRI